jgi:hypothetical protein
VINVVPGCATETDSTSDERERKLAGNSGGRVLERVTPSRIGCGEASPVLFFITTPKGDLNDGVREGQGERFRGETGVI